MQVYKISDVDENQMSIVYITRQNILVRLLIERWLNIQFLSLSLSLSFKVFLSMFFMRINKETYSYFYFIRKPLSKLSSAKCSYSMIK